MKKPSGVVGKRQRMCQRGVKFGGLEFKILMLIEIKQVEINNYVCNLELG